MIPALARPLVLLWTLSWTQPTMQPRVAGCEPETLLASPIDHAAVFVRHQSAFYLAHRDSMLDNRTPYFAAHWHQDVTPQSEPVFVLAVAGSSAVIADGDTSGWYDVRVKKLWSAWSCPSNFVRGR